MSSRRMSLLPGATLHSDSEHRVPRSIWNRWVLLGPIYRSHSLDFFYEFSLIKIQRIIFLKKMSEIRIETRRNYEELAVLRLQFHFSSTPLAALLSSRLKTAPNFPHPRLLLTQLLSYFGLWKRASSVARQGGKRVNSRFFNRARCCRFFERLFIL
jgi:hypothetical protein